MSKFFFITGCLLLSTITSVAQQTVPDGYFRSPVDFQILLSGSFAEVRSNHFHSGIDIRTGGQTGKPVYAVADGYVSRIYVSPYGFGKALYINHPSGHTSVYGHLDRFNKTIGAYARKQQYANESFFLDKYVSEGTLVVKKGDIIGYSGNSGSSGGPHLHFEIRDLDTQEPLEPVDFGIRITDNIDPQIRGIKVYPLGPGSMVNNTTEAVAIKASGENGSYRLSSGDTLLVSGNIFFGIEAYDYHNNSSIRCGVKSIELFVDGKQIFGQRIDRFSFS